MTSSSLDARKRTYVRLIGEIQHALHQALVEEFEKRQLTRTGMAEALNTDKSFVTRKLNGTSNMTLETLADLAYALDRAVRVQLVSRTPAPGANFARQPIAKSMPSAAITPAPAPGFRIQTSTGTS